MVQMWRSKFRALIVELFELIDAGLLLGKTVDGAVQFAIGHGTGVVNTERVLKSSSTFSISVEVVERLGFAEKGLLGTFSSCDSMLDIREVSIELLCLEISQGTVGFEGTFYFFHFRRDDTL